MPATQTNGHGEATWQGGAQLPVEAWEPAGV